MILKYFYFGWIFYLHFQIILCKSESERITYFSIERPIIHGFDQKYLKNLTVQSRRLSRQDPRHYMRIYMHTLEPMNNSVGMDFYFYQFLTNRYWRSFVEMHFKFCDMVNHDPIFGEPMRKAFGTGSCPYPAGEYDLQNLLIPFVPKSFPFVKGRIYCNVSYTVGGVTKAIISASVDMEIKTARILKTI